jgi:hypothetical protein
MDFARIHEGFDLCDPGVRNTGGTFAGYLRTVFGAFVRGLSNGRHDRHGRQYHSCRDPEYNKRKQSFQHIIGGHISRHILYGVVFYLFFFFLCESTQTLGIASCDYSPPACAAPGHHIQKPLPGTIRISH